MHAITSNNSSQQQNRIMKQQPRSIAQSVQPQPQPGRGLSVQVRYVLDFITIH